MTNVALKMPLPLSVSLHKPKIDCKSRQPKSDCARQKHQNNIPPRSRERGVILTLQGWRKLQTAKSESEFQENAGDRFTLEELSERTELSLNTISKVLGRLESVDRSSLQTVFASFSLALEKNDYSHPNSPLKGLDIRQKHLDQDKGEAVEVSLFSEQEQELKTLRQWVSAEPDRMIVMLEIGGISKSTLAIKLASQTEQELEIVVLRSACSSASLSLKNNSSGSNN